MRMAIPPDLAIANLHSDDITILSNGIGSGDRDLGDLSSSTIWVFRNQGEATFDVPRIAGTDQIEVPITVEICSHHSPYFSVQGILDHLRVECPVSRIQEDGENRIVKLGHGEIHQAVVIQFTRRNNLCAPRDASTEQTSCGS